METTKNYEQMTEIEQMRYNQILPKFEIYSEDDEFKENRKFLIGDIVSIDKTKFEDLQQDKFYLFKTHDFMPFLRKVDILQDRIILKAEKPENSLILSNSKEQFIKVFKEIYVCRMNTVNV